MLADSNLLDQLEQYAFSPTGVPLCLYGDPAYPLRVHLQSPFKGAVLTPDMMAYNKSMSTVRTSVEWIFGDTIKSFKFLDFKNNLKIGLSTVGKMYIVCSLIRNALTCMYGNQSCEFFDLDPPLIQEYFSWTFCFALIFIKSLYAQIACYCHRHPSLTKSDRFMHLINLSYHQSIYITVSMYTEDLIDNQMCKSSLYELQ